MDARTKRTLLILEDEPFIALDVADAFRNTAYNVLTLGSCSEAMNWLQFRTPAVAILDISLRDGECTEVAATLVERQVPFVVHSGYVDGASEVFSQGRWIDKPAQPHAILDAVDALNPPQ
jgi:DNA-binding NtrC family response regulator